MKRPLFLVMALLCMCVTFLNAQETVPARQTPAEELVKQRNGEVIDFQKLLRRYETAVKENNLTAANKIKAELTKVMKKRVANVAAEKGLDELRTAELNEQQAILKATEAFEFTGKREDFNKSVEHLRDVQRFCKLMEKNFVTE
ncbi:MAG: hypothetical protein AAFZ15_30980 [Bacteroidota bacterium]